VVGFRAEERYVFRAVSYKTFSRKGAKLAKTDLMPPTIFAEVLDKEPTVQWVWMAHAPLAIAGYFCCRRSSWWLALFLPLAITLTLAGTEELWDRWAGAAIWHESSSLYIQWHLGMVIGIAGPVLGSFKRMWAMRSSGSKSRLKAAAG
jgi:hypothetical protein